MEEFQTIYSLHNDGNHLEGNSDLPSVTAVKANRDRKTCRKLKGGGIIINVNYQWFSPDHNSLKVAFCCQDLELLALSLFQSRNHDLCLHPSES